MLRFADKLGFKKAPAAGLRAAALGALLCLPGCQDAPVVARRLTEPVPVNGVGYVVFNAPINQGSRGLLMADIEKLRLAGASEIDLGMNSPGGEVGAAQGIVDDMSRLHAQYGTTFKAYNLGLVASAATYVFLNAQTRYAQPRSTFLFHAAGAVSTGAVSAENLRDEAAKIEAYESIVRRTLKARTRLNDAEATTYIRRTVLLNADDARRDGIVDDIATFLVPKGGESWVITVKPPAGAAKPATPALVPAN